MSALALPRPTTAPGRVPRRRSHLQLVGPGFVPPAPRPRTPVAAPAGAAVGAPRRAAIRLTARGRLVRSVLALVVGMLVAIGAGGWLGSLGAQEYSGPLERVSVTAGDTLWAIAAASAGSGQDVRDVVDDIVQINGLGTAEIAVGQQLLVPAG